VGPAITDVRQRWQPVELIFGPSVFDRNVLALDIAGVLQTLAKRAQAVGEPSYDTPPRKLITGIAGCCARVASGQPAAAPMSRVMNSRHGHRRSSIWACQPPLL
jgi:hypothetical protein